MIMLYLKVDQFLLHFCVSLLLLHYTITICLNLVLSNKKNIQLVKCNVPLKLCVDLHTGNKHTPF